MRLAIFRDTGFASRLLKAAEDYADQYVFDAEEMSSEHEPTEFERMLLKDMLNGLFADEVFADILQEAARGMKLAGMDPEGIDLKRPVHSNA